MPYLSIQMACRRLPYYHRFLHRENFSSPLKVVYRKQLKEEKGYTGKHQWDLIHNPESVLFSWLEDEKEAEKLDFSALMTLIDKIREANQKEYQSLEIMQDQCPNVIYKNVPLGDNKIDYLQMNCSKEFQNAKIDEERINSLIKVEMEFGSKLMLSPGEKSLVYSQTTLGDAIAYQFHEVKKSNTIPLNIEMTDNFLFEFAVLKKDKEKFEEYLFPSKAPLPGDPLIQMQIQGTDQYNLNNRVGGTYGCVRYTDDVKKQNCDIWEENITNFPNISGKNKVHDGLDLTAQTNTPVYSMYKGTATVGYSSTLGYYVLITSTTNQHNLSFETNNIPISYGHLSSYIASIQGKTLEAGTLIGFTGNSGSIASKIGPWQYHLHVTVYSGDSSNKYNRVNPANYLTTKFDNDGNKIE